MSIELNADQKKALDQIKEFLNQHAVQVYILTGSAGTGKTTLLKALVEELKKKHDIGLTHEQLMEEENLHENQRRRPFQLLATTGRAAKILRDKTGTEAKTIHSVVYKFDKVDASDKDGGDPWDEKNETGQLYLNFSVSPPPKGRIPLYLVDEASMINAYDVEEIGTSKYGSGNILRDFLEMASTTKIIFVGDYFQLPPVGNEVHSAALDPIYFRDRLKIVAWLGVLNKVMRQAEESEVLRLAIYVRNLLDKKQLVKWPQLPLPNEQNVHLLPDAIEMVKLFTNKFKSEGPFNSIILCYSNDDVKKLNQHARRLIHGHDELVEGDLLMVVQNSYTTDLVNGDQVTVEKIHRIFEHANLGFIDVELKTLHDERVFRTYMLQHLLYNTQSGINSYDHRMLIIDFDKRMKNLNIVRNSDTYKQRMMEDPFLNAVRAKFGYAITVHKAQGGEWKNVFLYINKSLFGNTIDENGHFNLNRSQAVHRWLYTAITRSSGHLWINDGFWIEGYNHRSGNLPYKDIREGRAQLTIRDFADATSQQGKKFQYVIGQLLYDDGHMVPLAADGNRLFKPFQISRPGTYQVHVIRNSKQFPKVEIIR